MGSLPKYISVNIEIRVPIVCKTIAVNKFEISTKTPTKKILKIAKNDGVLINYDRSNDTNIGLLSRYNRFKAGHPIGFIEAFANYYVDLYKALSDFKLYGKFSSDYILSIDKTLEGLKLFENAHKASMEKNWIKL